MADQTTGALFIGLLFAAGLCGITATQAFTFFRAGRRHPAGHKVAVAYLLLLDLLQLFFMGHTTYFLLITDPGDSRMEELWSFKARNFAFGFLVASTQTLYIIRIWRLTPARRRFLPRILASLLVLVFGAWMYISCYFTMVHQHKQFRDSHVNVIIPVTLGSMSLLDLVISIALIYTLAKSGSNLRWTDSSTTMLGAYILNSGLGVSIFSFACVIADLLQPTGYVLLSLETVSAEIYVNSFLAMLNARDYLQPGNRSPVLVLQSRGTSFIAPKLGDMEFTTSSAENSFTINEAGLPLFTSRTSPCELNNPQVVEVMVQREEHCSKM